MKQDSELLTLLKAQFICCTTLNVCHVINHCFHNNISFLNLKYKTINQQLLNTIVPFKLIGRFYARDVKVI